VTLTATNPAGTVRFPDIRLRFEDHGGCWKFRVVAGVQSTKALKQAVEELPIPRIRKENLISRNLDTGQSGHSQLEPLAMTLTGQPKNTFGAPACCAGVAQNAPSKLAAGSAEIGDALGTHSNRHKAGLDTYCREDCLTRTNEFYSSRVNLTQMNEQFRKQIEVTFTRP
jgi:hypothetical protein